MNDQIIITSGKKYLDIDAYSSILAYRTLLRARGYDAYAVSTAKPNESVSNIITDLEFTFDEVAISSNAKFIILDVSNPEFFDTFVKESNIVEIIDHHTGYEDYWSDKKTPTQIEFIGSVCTIIAERFLAANLQDLLTPELCKLLIAGILDNTLNLQTANTTDRDRKIYESLLQIGNIEESWKDEYFASCFATISNDFKYYLRESLKIEKVSSILPKAFAQLIVPSKQDIHANMEIINDALSDYEEWILNAILLSDGFSLLICSSHSVCQRISTLFKKFEIQNNWIILPKTMLRKEIMKTSREYESSKNRPSF